MSWLIVAKIPLLMSSRITSAGLTVRSSARSLTVIVAGSSTAPRSRGSATWTAVCPKAPSRRGGFRGPRRPRVPLLLLANESSSGCCRFNRGQQLGSHGGREWGDESTRQQAAAGGSGDAGHVATDVGATAGRSAGRVEAHGAVRAAHDPQK